MNSFEDILNIIKRNSGIVVLITDSLDEKFSFCVINELKNNYKIIYNKIPEDLEKNLEKVLIFLDDIHIGLFDMRINDNTIIFIKHKLYKTFLSSNPIYSLPSKIMYKAHLIFSLSDNILKIEKCRYDNFSSTNKFNIKNQINQIIRKEKLRKLYEQSTL